MSSAGNLDLKCLGLLVGWKCELKPFRGFSAKSLHFELLTWVRNMTTFAEFLWFRIDSNVIFGIVTLSECKNEDQIMVWNVEWKNKSNWTVTAQKFSTFHSSKIALLFRLIKVTLSHSFSTKKDLKFLSKKMITNNVPLQFSIHSHCSLSTDYTSLESRCCTESLFQNSNQGRVRRRRHTGQHDILYRPLNWWSNRQSIPPDHSLERYCWDCHRSSTSMRGSHHHRWQVTTCDHKLLVKMTWYARKWSILNGFERYQLLKNSVTRFQTISQKFSTFFVILHVF